MLEKVLSTAERAALRRYGRAPDVLMHNPRRVASPIVLALIALFAIRALVALSAA